MQEFQNAFDEIEQVSFLFGYVLLRVKILWN